MIHIFRFPANWLVLSVVGMAWLCAVGISRLAHERWRWIITALILTDLLAFAQYVRVPWLSPAYLESPPSLAQSLIPSATASRLYHSPIVTGELSNLVLKKLDDYSFIKSALVSSYGMAFGLREVSSYQTLILQRAENFSRRLAAEGPASPLLSWRESPRSSREIPVRADGPCRT